MILEGFLFLLGKILFFTSAIYEQKSFPKPLSQEEESKYLALAKSGDKKAKDYLIEHNMRLVAHVAKKYAGTMDNDDLISAGSIGLIKAVNSFEESKGTRLATYTARCVENEILMLIRANKKYKNDISLSESVGKDKDGNDLNLIDLLFVHEDGVFTQAEKKIEAEKFVNEIKSVLSKREFEVLRLRYGLSGEASHPQREVAKILRISRSYVSRIEKKAVLKLKNSLKKEDYFL